jgi:hypothetical protein
MRRLNRIGFDTQLVGPENRMVSTLPVCWCSRATLRVKMALCFENSLSFALATTLCIVYIWAIRYQQQ